MQRFRTTTATVTMTKVIDCEAKNPSISIEYIYRNFRKFGRFTKAVSIDPASTMLPTVARIGTKSAIRWRCGAAAPRTASTIPGNGAVVICTASSIARRLATSASMIGVSCVGPVQANTYAIDRKTCGCRWRTPPWVHFYSPRSQHYWSY